VGEELPPSGNRRMLDLGCGGGSYLEVMARLGWDVCGIERSPTAASRAAERVGRERVNLGSIEDLDRGLTNFDLINLSHVLEHLTEPRSALRAIHTRLATHGKLRIIVPDASGLVARVFSRYWFGLDVPRHWL
jgi:2-polyprenyl-3-methyl-5-hydroxy-6-metoxy-1,4-benzoquinol methylase